MTYRPFLWLVCLVAVVSAAEPEGAGDVDGGLIVTVEEGPVAPFAFYHAAITSDGEWLYVVGGQDDTRTEEGQFYSAAWRIRPGTGEWEALPDYPFPVAGAQAALVGRVLYVLGGAVPSVDWSEWGEGEAVRSAEAVAETWGSRSYAAEILASVRRLDLDAPERGWEEVDYLLYPRTDFGLGVVGGHLVALGGNYYTGSTSLDGGPCDVQSTTGALVHCMPLYAESFDPAEGAWVRDAPVVVPRSWAGVASVAREEEEVLVVGGGATYGATASAVSNAGDLTERYDAGAFTLTDVASPTEIGPAVGVGYEGSAWLLSGSYGGPGGTVEPSRLFGYDPGRDRWVYADLDFARVYPGLVAVGDDLWVIGGYVAEPSSMGTPLPMLKLSLELAPTVGGGCGGSVRVRSAAD